MTASANRSRPDRDGLSAEPFRVSPPEAVVCLNVINLGLTWNAVVAEMESSLGVCPSNRIFPYYSNRFLGPGGKLVHDNLEAGLIEPD
jgi:hypothetical protein